MWTMFLLKKLSSKNTHRLTTKMTLKNENQIIQDVILKDSCLMGQ
jgi:hypothetical protein